MLGRGEKNVIFHFGGILLKKEHEFLCSPVALRLFKIFFVHLTLLHFDLGKGGQGIHLLKFTFINWNKATPYRIEPWNRNQIPL